MGDLKSIELVETIAVPKEQVYAAFSSSVALQSWFSDFAEVDFLEKGRLYCWWNVGYYASGLFTTIRTNEQIGFTWSGPDEPHGTFVDIFFISREDIPKAYAPEVDLTELRSTEVRIQHSGIGAGDEWTERLTAYKYGWETALANLKSVLETGFDKRIFDRPMLGIIPGEIINDDKAAELDIPVSHGIILAGTVEGMGAEAAGLRKDDVLVSLNRRELNGYQDITPALARTKSGDVVEVTFYRGGEKRTINMTLSHRQIPEVPQSAQELGNSVAKIYGEVAAERDSLFEGVSDAQASVRPHPDSWSAKETFVHLLYTERWLHLAISLAVSEQRTGGFANQIDFIGAVASLYSLEGLLAELKQSEAITVAVLKALPEDFVADKRKFLSLAFTIGQGYAQHSRDHFDQINNAIKAAKAT
jgi:uncharacterized protein YndB with AHSA1/START domain